MLARIGLLPVLLAQALYVRKRAKSLPEPHGARRGITGTGPELHLLIVGDSSAAGVGVTTQDDALLGQMITRLSPHYRLHWTLIAQTGVTTGEALEMLKQHTPWRCDVVITGLGVNDVTHLVSRRKFIADQAALLDYLTQHFGAPLICASGIPPMRDFPLLPHPLRWVLGRQAVRFDRALQQIAETRDNCRYMLFDMPYHPSIVSEDGFHPGPPVFAHWADTACRYIPHGPIDGVTDSA